MTQPPHPCDEFDGVVAPRDGRRGAHRARPGRLRAAAAPALVALVVAAAGGAAVVVLGPNGPGTGSSAVAATPDAGAAADAAGTPSDATADPAADPAAGDASADGGTSDVVGPDEDGAADDAVDDASGDAVDDASDGAADDSSDGAGSSDADVDRSAPVVVLNATRTKGLAATTAAQLQRSGWTVSSTGNERSGAVASTTVTYSSSSLRASAEALAAEVGGTAERDSGAASGRLVVVLGADAAA